MNGFETHIRKMLVNSKWGLVKDDVLDNNTAYHKELEKLGRLSEYISDIAYSKVSDADFQTVMRSVGFNKTPREVLTILDMERHYLMTTRVYSHIHICDVETTNSMRSPSKEHMEHHRGMWQ